MADREGPIQRSIIAWLNQVMPDAMVHHSPNEHRRRQGLAAINHAQANKRNGVVTGFPDLIVLPYANVGPVFFEVKAPGGYPSKAQKAVHADLAAIGYRVAVVRSIDDARDALRLWGIETKEAT